MENLGQTGEETTRKCFKICVSHGAVRVHLCLKNSGSFRQVLVLKDPFIRAWSCASCECDQRGQLH